MEDELSRAFKALGHPHRLAIVRWLLGRTLECCEAERVEDCTMDPASCNAGELVEAVDVAPSTLSHHLKELENAGLVERVRDGRYILCRVRRDRLAELGRFLVTGDAGASAVLAGSNVVRLRTGG
ncbi:MAG: ArsR/SmtB family transcription factor [Gemmatimonadota bacterium]